MKNLYKFYQYFYLRTYTRISKMFTLLYFYLNGVRYKNFTSLGIPIIDVHVKGICEIDQHLVMINTAKYSALGKSNRCKIVVLAGAKLTIGRLVGMSNATIITSTRIVIGNNVLIGGGVTIVDTDFHSLNPCHWHTSDDTLNMHSTAVLIKDNVFIGMNSIILKGVTIGNNVIIGAGSVVTKDIPDNQIWGGNPAVFIKTKESNLL